MTEFTKEGVHLAYDDLGTGPAVLFSHCWYCDSRQWPQAEAVARAGFRVLNVDNRGHGRSGPYRARHTLWDVGDDLVRVLDHANEERAVLVGLSVGAFAAMRAAVRHSSRVRGLVLAGVIAGLQTPSERFKARILLPVIRTPARRRLDPTLAKILFGPTTLRTKPELVAEWRTRFAGQDPVSMAVAGDAALVHRDDFTPHLAEIRVPTLVLMGDEDPERPLAAAMAAAIHGARFVSLPGAGHLSSVEAPRQFEDALLHFLQQLDGPSAEASTAVVPEPALA